jgi:hypothetical protein
MNIRLCATDQEWTEVADDYSYWESDIGDDEDEESDLPSPWQERCEQLDERLRSLLGSDTFLIDDITNWRERGVELSEDRLNRDMLEKIRGLLTGDFSTWRIVIKVSSPTKRGYLGVILVWEAEAAATAEVYSLATR